jgi:hypothetical protein
MIVKIHELSRLKIEVYRQNGSLEGLYTKVYRPVVADLHHLHEEQDPDPDPQLKLRAGPGSELK